MYYIFSLPVASEMHEKGLISALEQPHVDGYSVPFILILDKLGVVRHYNSYSPKKGNMSSLPYFLKTFCFKK